MARSPLMRDEAMISPLHHSPSSASLPSCTTPKPPPGHTSDVRQNHVSTVSLYGVSIVSLWIDGRERLCLAQISNTLLKDYSYNEIHNRRVALGITCVQCTPVQLEILRRAGAMPVSSRRCGMITKREAERLVKSFLEEMAPPKLPDDFAFDVSHACGWGCRGNFIPSRYNSSRAKCVKCYYCNMHFSPNKFIFHFHRMPDSKYQHPDAANFNSWRRHLTLTDPQPSDDLMHAWEDVKAMFNGGSRKRVMAASAQSFTKNQDNAGVKRMKSQQPPRDDHQPQHRTAPSPAPQHRTSTPLKHMALPSFPAAYPFPLFPGGKPMPSQKPFPLLPGPLPGLEKLNPGSIHPFLSPHLVAQHGPRQTSHPAAQQQQSQQGAFQGNQDTVYPSYEMIWAKHLGISMYNENNYPPRCLIDNNNAKANLSAKECINKANGQDNAKFTGHFSAFKPVSAVGLFKPYENLESSNDYSGNSDNGSMSDSGADLSDSENIDVDTVEDDNKRQDNAIRPTMTKADDAINSSEDLSPFEKIASPLRDSVIVTSVEQHHAGDYPNQPRHEEQHSHNEADTHSEADADHQLADDNNHAAAAAAVDYDDDVDDNADFTNIETTNDNDNAQCDDNDNCLNLSKEPTLPETPPPSHDPQPPILTLGAPRVLPVLDGLSKAELQDELATALETRQRLEKEFNMIKNTFEKQASKESAYREEMARQIQVVRESLFRELEHERRTRASLQQKLIEAQDAITKFSYKMLDTGPC